MLRVKEASETTGMSGKPASRFYKGTFFLTFVNVLFLTQKMPVLDSYVEQAIHEPKEHIDNNDDDWSEANCFEPLRKTILGTHDLSRILNLGLPKCGSTSLSALFKKSGFHRADWYCSGGYKYCGTCMKQNLDNNKTMLDHCGNYTVFTQMDYNLKGMCIFPQIMYLDELYAEAPDATWILPFRNVTKWVSSVTHWYDMRDRFSTWCDFPQLNFTKSDTSKTDGDFVQLFCSHVKHVRQFVKAHPSLSLVEFSIEDSGAGEFLANVFPVNSTYWGQENKNWALHRADRTKR